MTNPRPNQTVLLRWKRKSDGWEFISESCFIVDWYPNDGAWISVNGGYFSIPVDFAGYGNEVIEWTGFDIPGKSEIESNAYKQAREDNQRLIGQAKTKLTPEERVAIGVE